jgi:tetratricopeptide (TPR) repeat protein
VDIYLSLAESYLAKGDLHLALAESVKANKYIEYKEDVRPLIIMGRCLLSMKDYAQAEKVFDILASTKKPKSKIPPHIYPSDTTVLTAFNLAIIYENTRRYAKALTQLQFAEEKKHNTVETALLLILCYFENQEYEKVIKTYERYRSIFETPKHISDSTVAGIFILIGISMFQLKKYDQGIAMLKRALKFNPNAVDAYLYMGHIDLSRRATIMAKKNYEAAVKLDPNLEKVLGPILKVLK